MQNQIVTTTQKKLSETELIIYCGFNHTLYSVAREFKF